MSGESLSARAAAARTRDCLVEEAEVAQTSDELEAVSNKLAQLFPARMLSNMSVGIRLVDIQYPTYIHIIPPSFVVFHQFK